MVSEVYDSLLAAGAPESKARAAAEAIRAGEEVVTKADLEAAIAKLETRIWKAGITIAGLAVLLNKFLDWAVR